MFSHLRRLGKFRYKKRRKKPENLFSHSLRNFLHVSFLISLLLRYVPPLLYYCLYYVHTQQLLTYIIARSSFLLWNFKKHNRKLSEILELVDGLGTEQSINMCLRFKRKKSLEANHSQNFGLPLYFPTDRHPLSLSDLLQNHMSTSNFIRAHAQEV